MTKKTINDDLGKLENIVKWFEERQEVDVEAGLDMIREGASLIKKLKSRLNNVENEFEEIKEEFVNPEG